MANVSAVKTSRRNAVLALTALLAISACGGSDSSSEAAPLTKNAALPPKQGLNIQPKQQPTITTMTTMTTEPPFQAPATTVTLVQEKSVDCKTTTTIAGQNSLNSQRPSQKPDPRKIGNSTSNMAVPTVATSTLNDYSAPTTTQVKDCVTTAAVVSTTAPTTLAPTTTASAKTNVAPVVTSAPTTTAKKPVCDAVRKKRRLC